MKHLTDRILYLSLFARTLVRQRRREGGRSAEKRTGTPDASGIPCDAPLQTNKNGENPAADGPSPSHPDARNAAGVPQALGYGRFFEFVEAEADLIPRAFYDGLNLGIITEEEEKRSPAGENLYILGEYRTGPAGRQICLFYGSFIRHLGADVPEERLRAAVREVLRHEFRHHMEGRAGIRDLEIEDQRWLEEFLRHKKSRPEDGE